MQIKKKSLASSTVGPTIKPSSRLSGYFPTIIRRDNEVRDEGEIEPLLQTIEKADVRDIDGIQFWSAASAAEDNQTVID